MKKFYIINIIFLLLITLSGCTDSPRKINKPILLEQSEVVTELDLSDEQLNILLNNTIEMFLEIDNGYLVVHYETDRTIKYITYFTYFNIEISMI